MSTKTEIKEDREAEKVYQAEEKREVAHQKELKHEEAEREKRASTKIQRFAADLLEQSSRRDRDVIENEVAMAVTNEAQGALIRAIIAHIDGNLPEAVVPKERTYSEVHKRAEKEMEDAKLEAEKKREKPEKHKNA